MDKDEHTLGFIVKPDGEYIEFGRRKKKEMVTGDIHYREIQKVISQYFLEELGHFLNITDIDTLSLLIATITKSIVFLDTTKYFGNTGCMYLPNIITDQQHSKLLEIQEYLLTFNMKDSIAHFDLIYNEQIKQYEMLPIKSYESVSDFYSTLKSKSK